MGGGVSRSKSKNSPQSSHQNNADTTNADEDATQINGRSKLIKRDSLIYQHKHMEAMKARKNTERSLSQKSTTEPRESSIPEEDSEGEESTKDARPAPINPSTMEDVTLLEGSRRGSLSTSHLTGSEREAALAAVQDAAKGAPNENTEIDVSTSNNNDYE